jgi:hypothetical protein
VILVLSSSLKADDWIYTFVEGDNLWNLSEKHLDSVTRFEQLQKINNITRPKYIPPGTRIRVPLAWIRSNPVPATITTFTGSAEIQRAGQTKSRAIEKGMKIYLGDKIRTANASSLSIKLADQSILTLHELSLVRFDHLSAHGTTGMVDSRLNLLEGRLETTVTPAAGPGSRFEIKTPSAISAVRGTEYRALTSNEGRLSNIEVLHGKVAVQGVKQEKLIEAGFGTQVIKGQDPLPPTKLLPAPVLTPIPPLVEHVNWPISWAKVEGAKQYRIEISSSHEFETLLWQQLTSHEQFNFPDFDDGHYAFRVRAIDHLQLEGHNQTASLVLNAHPQPPIALSPANDETIRGDAPDLQWTAAEEASRYRLQIATNEDFNDLVFDDADIMQAHFNPNHLSKPMRYYWRIASIAADGEKGPFGQIRSYQLKPIPASVAASVSPENSGFLTASWQPSASNQRYHVQLANNKEFTDLIIDTVIDQPELVFEATDENKRFLRIKNIESDGYEGVWGQVQSIEPQLKEVSYWPLVVQTILFILIL